MEIRKGKYSYSVNNFNGTYTRHEINVEILAETEKSYKIKLLSFTDKRVPGNIIWVSKKNVKTDEKVKEKIQNKESGDSSGYWWENI